MFAFVSFGKSQFCQFFSNLTSITKLSSAAYAEEIWHDKITHSLLIAVVEWEKHPYSILLPRFHSLHPGFFKKKIKSLSLDKNLF